MGLFRGMFNVLKIIKNQLNDREKHDWHNVWNAINIYPEWMRQHQSDGTVIFIHIYTWRVRCERYCWLTRFLNPARRVWRCVQSECWVSVCADLGHPAGYLIWNDWCAANRPNGKDTSKNIYIDYKPRQWKASLVVVIGAGRFIFNLLKEQKL